MGNTNLLAEDLDHVLNQTKDLWNEIRNSRIFITGGTGFFGTWLVESFLWANQKLELNADAVVLTRNPNAFVDKAPHLAANPSLRFHKGDVRNFDFPDETFSHVIHAAIDVATNRLANHPLLMLDTVLQGTRRALDFAVDCHARKFLMISSGAVYGKQPAEVNLLSEDYEGAPDVIDPMCTYGEGKRVAELLCTIYKEEHGIETKIARCFAFVGPYLPIDTHFAIGNFIRDAIDWRPIRVRGGGSTRRSYLYAADLSIWLLRILIQGKPCYPYNVGSDKEISTANLAELVGECVEPSVPVCILRQKTENRVPDRYVPSVQRAVKDLGLRQTIGLEEAIRKTIRWHRQRRRMEN